MKNHVLVVVCGCISALMSCGMDASVSSTKASVSSTKEIGQIDTNTRIRGKAISSPAGDLEVVDDGTYIRFSGAGLSVTKKNDTVILAYRDQTAEFFGVDISYDGATTLLRRGALPLSANNRKIPQQSVTGAETEAYCQCSQCIFFVEVCCIPNTEVVGACFGFWDCYSPEGCGS